MENKLVKKQLYDLKRSIITTGKAIKNDISRAQSNILLEGLKVDNIFKTEACVAQIHEMEDRPALKYYSWRKNEGIL